MQYVGPRYIVFDKDMSLEMRTLAHNILWIDDVRVHPLLCKRLISVILELFCDNYFKFCRLLILSSVFLNLFNQIVNLSITLNNKIHLMVITLHMHP